VGTFCGLATLTQVEGSMASGGAIEFRMTTDEELMMEFQQGSRVYAFQRAHSSPLAIRSSCPLLAGAHAMATTEDKLK
jgi:hypothetical protein